MATQTEIANGALAKLGEMPIVSIDDANKKAATIKGMWNRLRDSEIRKRKWSFAIKRASLTADVATPEHGYIKQFERPADCLRILSVANYDVSSDVSDYVGSLIQPFTFEGSKILISSGVSTENGALQVRYLARIEDTTQWDACFAEAFACKLAAEACEPITQSTTRRQMAQAEYREAIAEAVRANAIEKPAERINDDSWILSRLR